MSDQDLATLAIHCPRRTSAGLVTVPGIPS